MDKKFIFLICCMIFCPLSMAETCPSVDAIKNHTLKGWVAYDSDDGTRLSPHRAKEFRNLVTQFTLAEWVTDGDKNGTIHCYYRDRNGSDLEAYLKKDQFIIPKNTSEYWYPVSGFLQCAASAMQCEFQKNPLSARRLANK